MNDKKMYFANFNITFGKENEPMLVHFEDVIYPAFTRGYSRKLKDDNTIYTFKNVCIKKIDGDYVLVGDYVKDTTYSVYTKIKDNKLIEARSDVPTAPYSRFIIFLKNHRMVLIKNETKSPDIRSFQLTMRTVITQHRRYLQKSMKRTDIPRAIVNIVDIPSQEKLNEQLKNVKKIRQLKIRFFPLNNDKDFSRAIANVRMLTDDLGSERSSLQITSPDNIENICDFVDSSCGLVETTLHVTEKDGSKKKIKSDHFSTSMDIPVGGNVTPGMDSALIMHAKKNSTMLVESAENTLLYNKKKEVFQKLS